MNIIKGDLLVFAELGEFDLIMHGCNCIKVMGAGIACAIAKKWPNVYLADMNTTNVIDDKIGTYSFARVDDAYGDEFVVVNAYTQRTPAQDFYTIAFDYAAFESVLIKLNNDIDDLIDVRGRNNVYIGVPLIGCGLANADKSIVLQMLDQFEKLLNEQHPGRVYNLTVVEYKSQ